MNQLGERKSTVTEYCPKCNKETFHVFVRNDPYFELGALCTECGVTWEMIPGCDVVGFNKTHAYKG